MKNKKFTFILLVLVAMLAVTACGKKAEVKEEDKKEDVLVDEDVKDEVELTISAAASLTDVLEELKDTYTKDHPEIKINYSFGSSGALQAQIEEGAPVDLFFSAAEKQMDALEEKDLLLEGTRETLLINKVVLITPKDSQASLSSLEDLKNDDIKKIAIGDPSNVPVGQYSEEIFKNLNITDAVMPKAVLGTDVRTVLTWVENGEVDCGLVYKTDALTSDKVEILLEAPEGSHKKVTYPGAVVKDSKNQDQSKAFLEFLKSDQAAKAFEKYGFVMNK